MVEMEEGEALEESMHRSSSAQGEVTCNTEGQMDIRQRQMKTA